MKFLIINAYPTRSRNRLAAGNVTPPEDLFKHLIEIYAPIAFTDVCYIYNKKNISLDEYDAFIWSGSDQNVYSNDEYIKRQLDVMQAMLESGKPIWGSCWGTQIAVTVAGGLVSPHHKGRECIVAKDITADLFEEMFMNKPTCFNAYSMHVDTIEKVPDICRVIAHNNYGAQAVTMGSFWGTQYHPEFNKKTMIALAKTRMNTLIKEGTFKSEKNFYEVMDNFDSYYNIKEDISYYEFRNWIKIFRLNYYQL